MPKAEDFKWLTKLMLTLSMEKPDYYFEEDREEMPQPPNPALAFKKVHEQLSFIRTERQIPVASIIEKIPAETPLHDLYIEFVTRPESGYRILKQSMTPNPLFPKIMKSYTNDLSRWNRELETYEAEHEAYIDALFVIKENLIRIKEVLPYLTDLKWKLYTLEGARDLRPWAEMSFALREFFAYEGRLPLHYRHHEDYATMPNARHFKYIRDKNQQRLALL